MVCIGSMARIICFEQNTLRVSFGCTIQLLVDYNAIEDDDHD